MLRELGGKASLKLLQFPRESHLVPCIPIWAFLLLALALFGDWRSRDSGANSGISALCFLLPALQTCEIKLWYQPMVSTGGTICVTDPWYQQLWRVQRVYILLVVFLPCL